MPRTARVLSLLALLAVRTAVADEALDVVRPEEGYRIVRPDTRWAGRELLVPAGVHHAYKLERDPAPGEVSLTIYAGDRPPNASAESLCALNARQLKARAVGEIARTRGPLAGAESSSLTCDLAAFGTTVRIRQTYVVHGADVLLLQCQAPARTFPDHEKEFDAALSSLTFLPADPARDAARKLRALAAACGQDVPRAATWADASARALKEKRLVLVVFESFRGLPIPPLADATTFMDDDVVALAKERFIVLPWRDGLAAPFDAPDVYGFGPHTFGQGVVFATGDGRVVGSLGLLEPSLVDEAARAVLAANPDAVGAPADPLDAAAALRRGELDRAAKLLAKPKSADEFLLLASLERRRRRAREALAALDAAVAAGADAATVAVERGLLFLRLGRASEAGAAFVAAGDAPAARYWRCVLVGFRAGLASVRDELTALALDPAAGRWGRRAAALSLGRGVATGIESVLWPDDAVRASAAPRPYAPGDDADAAAIDAVSYLLTTQRLDGTWPAPLAFIGDSDAPTSTAVTAVVGAALLPQRGRPAVDAAVDRALDAVLRAHGRLVEPGGGVFDYSAWSRIFALRFLSRWCGKDATGTKAERVRGLAADIVAALGKTQAPSGGWSYARLEGAGASADNSISFVTAAAMLALADARDAGVIVPDELVRRAADAVEKLRREDGSWDYQTASRGIQDLTEAALRGPLCALALRRVGRGKPGEVERALAALVGRRDEALREAGKSLCHTAPDGTAAYYLLFGLRFAAEATSELPAEAALPIRRALREATLRLRRDDGSFCDFPPVGPAYGTAMALGVLAGSK